jgi:hypothetical protein
VTAPGAARTPAIAGFLIAGTAVLLIGFLVGERDSPDNAPPSLQILQPRAGDVVHNPVTVRFRTPADLRLSRGGWAARDLHLHLLLDGRELMPAAADIVAADTTFAWTLPPLPPGSHRVYLTWAGRHHGNLATNTDTITFHVAR